MNIGPECGRSMVRGLLASILAAATFCASANNSFLTGAFVHFGYGAGDQTISDGDIPGFFKELKNNGNDTIIVSHTRVNRSNVQCPASPNDFEWVSGFPGRLSLILDQAHANGIQVYVGTNLAGGACGKFWVNSTAIAAVRDDYYLSYSGLSSTYASHPAFKGVYIPDEPGPLPAEVHNYYRTVTSAIKSIFPGKQVAVAPFLGANTSSPSSIAAAAVSFKSNTGVDIQIWQDGLGASSVASLNEWGNSRPKIEQYYKALSQVLGEGLWADVELFNYGIPLFNTSASVYTGGYRPTAASRLNSQLWSARYATKRVSWLNQFHMTSTSNSPARYSGSSRLLQGYRAFSGIGGKSLVPVNYSMYSWITPPDSAYPDNLTNRKIFDRKVADPRSPSDNSWVGINGAARLVIDLGYRQNLDWVGVHLLNHPSWGIRAPVSLTVNCGDSLSAMRHVGVYVAPFSQSDVSGLTTEEYVLGNYSPIGVVCRYVELSMPNEYWTFMSEVEIFSEN